LTIGKSAISDHPFLYNIALSREKTACRLRTARGVCKGFSIRKNLFHSGLQWQKTGKNRLCLEIVFFLQPLRWCGQRGLFTAAGGYFLHKTPSFAQNGTEFVQPVHKTA